MNRVLMWIVLFFCCCNVSHTDKYQHWEELSERTKSQIIKSLNVDKNIMMLYLHQISLSDNKTSEAILDTLCMQTTDNNKRMFYFYILNDVVKNADGALAELLGAYCIKYVNENTDYALEYFSNHRDISNHYAQMIAAELYFNDISITDYKRTLRLSVKGKSAKDYLSVFLNIIEQNQRGLSISDRWGRY